MVRLDNPEVTAKFLEKAVSTQLETLLRKHLLEESKKIVDKVVEELQGELQTSLTYYRDQMLYKDILEIVVKDRR